MRFPNHPRVVVTGAASGLGREFCLQLAKRKAHILAADVNDGAVKETVALVKAAGGEAFAFHCDVSKIEDVEAMAKAALRRLKGVDVVINNAGVAAAGLVGEIPIADWQWILSINIWGVIHGCHVFVPILKKQGHGHIINVASSAGIASLPEMASYNVSKAGAISLSETLYAELRPHKIGVTAVCPTFFKTNLMDSFRSPQEIQRKRAQKFFDHASMTVQQVAEASLKGAERGELYVIPQLDGKALWRLKRIAPQYYFKQVAKQYWRGERKKARG